jgi:hypothetical protein
MIQTLLAYVVLIIVTSVTISHGSVQASGADTFAQWHLSDGSSKALLMTWLKDNGADIASTRVGEVRFHV